MCGAGAPSHASWPLALVPQVRGYDDNHLGAGVEVHRREIAAVGGTGRNCGRHDQLDRGAI